MSSDRRDLRVLWISHLLPWPPKGGLLQRSYNLLREVAKRHRVTLAALNQRALLPTPNAVREAVGALKDLCDEVHVCELPANQSRLVWAAVVAAGAVHPQPYDVLWLRSSAMHETLANLGATRSFDLIHLDTIGLYPYASRIAGTPAVLNHHNVESDMMALRAERETRAMLRWYFGRQAKKLATLEREAAPRVKVNLVVSELDAQRLRRISPRCAAEVVSNGVDVDYFRPNPRTRPPARSAVFIGGMNWYPNRDAMCFFVRQIWPRLLASDPSWKASIVGQTPPAEILAAAVPGKLQVPGFVEDARPWFDSASIYVCPITTGGGTRLKILDALAMAKPLVATKFAVEGLGLEEGEHYLGAETADEFVARLQCLAADPGLRERLSRNARHLAVERFSWASIGNRLDVAYRDAVAPSAGEP